MGPRAEPPLPNGFLAIQLLHIAATGWSLIHSYFVGLASYTFDLLNHNTTDTLNLDTLKLIRNIKKCEMKSANKPVL